MQFKNNIIKKIDFMWMFTALLIRLALRFLLGGLIKKFVSKLRFYGVLNASNLAEFK